MPSLGAPELIIVLVIVLVLFGAKRLPGLARSLGAASKEFKDGVAEGASDTASKATGAAQSAAAKVDDVIDRKA